MPTKRIMLLVSLAIGLSIAPSSSAQQLRAGILCSGAASLNNGSVVNIGQPFVGLTAASGGGALNVGFVPVLGSAKLAPPRASFSVAPLLENGNLQLTLASEPGVTYVLEATTNLVDWVSVNTNTAIGFTLLLEDANAGSLGFRFYRVRVE